MADSSAKRRTGLLKHERLEPGEGLWIVPCESVHTFFMKFPIDLVYLDKKRKVQKGAARGAGVAALGMPLGALGSGTAGRDRGADRHCGRRRTGSGKALTHEMRS